MTHENLTEPGTNLYGQMRTRHSLADVGEHPRVIKVTPEAEVTALSEGEGTEIDLHGGEYEGQLFAFVPLNLDELSEEGGNYAGKNSLNGNKLDGR